MGGALEFYDFVVFVFFTAAIGALFFPAGQPDWLRQLQTFGLFAAGYLARPVGGMVMAHFGDTRGRKRMFSLSVLMMALPTLAIGLLPTYGRIGAAAPLLLLAMRLVQGAAIGGEAPGGWVFVAEHAAPGRIGLAIGLLTGGLTGGILLGSLMATGLTLAVGPAAILAGWWRLPFLAGGVAGLGAMVLRRWLSETPVFAEIRASASLSRELPLRAVLLRHPRAVAVSMASTWMLTAAIVVVILMTPSLLRPAYGVSQGRGLEASLAGTVALCVSAVLTGMATDRFGLGRVALPMAALLAVATYALYLGASLGGAWLLPLSVLAGLGAGAVSLTPVLMVGVFPPAVRFSGLSASYNLAYAAFGGTTPLLVAWLVHLDRLAPAHYVALTCLLGLCAIVLAPRGPAGRPRRPVP